jgi:hypothetical protein
MRIKCPNCGAEFETDATGVVTCPYCGFQIVVGESEVFTYPLKVEDPWKPLVSFIQLQRLSPNNIGWKARLLERKLLWVPFYVFFVKARGSAHRKGIFSEDGAGLVEFFNYVSVPAAEGFDELVNYPLPTKGRRYFDGRVTGELVEKTLNVEDAEGILRREIRSLLKNEAKKYYRWSRVEIGMPTFEIKPEGLVYYPMWRISYKYGLFTYQAYVDGVDGRIPYVEFPISGEKRLVGLILSSLIIVSGAFLGKLLYPYGITAPFASLTTSAVAAYPSLRRALTIRGRASEHKLIGEAAEDYKPEEKAFWAIERFFQDYM